MSQSWQKLNTAKFRNLKKRFQQLMLNTDDGLTCVYCGQTDLIIKYHEDPEIPQHRRFTVDHLIPVSRGGSMTDINNFIVACEKCNLEKGNK